MATRNGGPEQRPTLLQRAGTAAAELGAEGRGHPATRLALQWGMAIVIFGFLIWFVLRQWNQLPDFDWHFVPGWLAISAVAVLLFYLGQNEIWRLILHALGEDHLRPRPARAIWGKSLLARYVPTNALMVVTRIVMSEKEGVPRRVCLASIVYELGLGFGTAVMVGAYFVIQLPELESQPTRYAVLLLIPIVLAGFHPKVFAPIANWGLGKLGRDPLPRALSFRRVVELSLMFIVTWAIMGVGVYAFARALTPVEASDFPYIAAAYPVAFCVAVITFIVPSGLGTRDAALAIAISAVLDETVATAIAVGFRIFQTVAELAYVGIVVWLARNVPARVTQSAS